MTENTRNGGDFWGEEGDDDEQTQVAMNPLHRSSVPPLAAPLRPQPRSVSSFGTPRSSRPPDGTDQEHGASGRPSLYDRLLQSGALDQGIVSEARRESSRPLDPGPARSASLGLPPPPELRDLADALEGDGRESGDELRMSDLDVLDAKAPPALPLEKTGSRPAMPKPIPSAHVPSMLLGPGASTRNDATERFSHMPSTHPLANSLAPTALSGHPPPVEKKAPLWLIAVAAVMLVGAGVAIGRFRTANVSNAVESSPVRVSVAQAPKPVAIEPAVPQAAPAVDAPVEVDDALPAVAPPVEPEVAKSEENAAEEEAGPSPGDERAARRAAREAARRASAREVAPVAEQALAPVSTSQTIAAVPSVEASKPSEATQPKLPAGPLLAQPSREQVVATMEKVVPALTKCVGDKHGTANVSMTVRSAGTVSYALVGGTFAGTPEGSCIARVIKQAEFPAFSDPTIRVTYPFQL